MADYRGSTGAGVIRVLHVDDDASNLEISKKILMDMGCFDIDFACCVDEAFQKMKQRTYDAIISDYEMPLKNGLQFLEELRIHKDKPQIPFILLTGKGREEVAIKALNLGADAYVNKQGNPETVYGELSHALVKTIERKRDAEALKKNEEQLKAIILNAPIGIAWSSSNQIFLSANESFCRILGYSEKELQKLTFKDLTHPEEINSSILKMQELQSGQIQFFTQEKRYIRKDGTIIHGKVTVSAIRNNEGKPELFVAELEDITERKKAEDLLRKSEERYRILADSLPEIVFEADNQGKLTYVNQRAFKMTGYAKEDLNQGLTVLDFVAPEDRLRAKNNFSKKLTNNLSGTNEYTFVRKDSSTFPTIVSSSPIILQNRTVGLRGLIIDITEHKKAEEALAESEAKYRALVENANDAILLSDLRGKSIFRNRAYFRNLGFEENEQADAESFAKLHPDDLVLVREKTAELMKTGFSTLEYRVRHWNGSWVYRHARSAVILNSVNRPYAVLSIIRDVTDRKQAEEKLKESSRRIEMMNEKLRVVGSLTRHDVRNKLAAVTGYAYLLKKRHRDQPDIVEGANKIEQAIKDSERIFEFSRMYERLGAEELTYIDLEQAVDEAKALFSGLPFKVAKDCHGLCVLADSFLRQLFYNFIDNTAKYGKTATTIKVSCKPMTSGQMRLVYEDDGTGIPAENKSKLFVEGFSTGGGKGFGLFLIKKMLDVYGWTIAEEGEPCKGAKFAITIPKIGKNGKENYRIAAN